MLLSPKSNQHCFDWISLGIQQVRKPCIPRLDHLDSKVGDADCGSTMAKVCSLMVGWVFRDLMYDPGGSDLGQAVEIMNQCMNAWLNKQMKEWMDEIMNEWMHDWINEEMDGWMNEWMNGRKLHKMNERKFHKMNERNWHKMNEWTNERINEFTSAESCLDVFSPLRWRWHAVCTPKPVFLPVGPGGDEHFGEAGATPNVRSKGCDWEWSMVLIRPLLTPQFLV